MTALTPAAAALKNLVARLHSENRFFHMEDDITEFDMFSEAEQAEFGAIIETARNELSAKAFDDIIFG